VDHHSDIAWPNATGSPPKIVRCIHVPENRSTVSFGSREVDGHGAAGGRPHELTVGAVPSSGQSACDRVCPNEAMAGRRPAINPADFESADWAAEQQPPKLDDIARETTSTIGHFAWQQPVQRLCLLLAV
jgi:hypothetical protein